MFICLRHSAPSSLAPCSCLCPKLSGHFMAWVVRFLHFQGSSVAYEYAEKKKNPSTPRAFGVSSWPTVAVFSALGVAFLRQGVPLFHGGHKAPLTAGDRPIPAPRETRRHSRGSRLPTAVTSLLTTDACLWDCSSRDECRLYKGTAHGDVSARFRFRTLVSSLYLELKCHHVSSP